MAYFSMRRRRLLSAGSLALALVGLSGATAPTAAAPAESPAAVSKPDMPDNVLAEYRAYYRDVPVETLYQRLSLSGPRKQLLSELAKSPTFGGSWYDYRTGVWHVLTTNANEAREMTRRAAAIGVDARARVVRHSFDDLVARARQISAGRDPLSKVSRVTSVDTMANRVVLTVEPGRPYGAADPMVRYETGRAPTVTEDACNSRRDCVEQPLKTGLIMWKDMPNGTRRHHCSLGFVAKGRDGSLWALTAGHCVDAIDELWGHSYSATDTQWYLGVARQCIVPVQKPRYPCLNDGYRGVDAARIRISSSFWQNNTYGSFGWTFQLTSSGSVAMGRLHDRADELGDFEAGEVVCLSAWHQSKPGWAPPDLNAYDSPDECGVIENVVSNHYNMIRVASVVACMGDSGGGWLSYPSGQRWAAGLHHGHDVVAPDGPPALNCGDTAYFSSLPDVDMLWDANSSAGFELRAITAATPNGYRP